MEINEEINDSPPALKKLKENDCDNVTNIPSALENNPGFTIPTPFSKNQLKKQRKLANLEQYRKEKRKQEKERQKQKRKEALEQGLPTRTGPSRKELKKKQTLTGNNENAQRVVIDLDCDDMMTQRDIAKCVKQCLRIYTINRRSENPVQIHFTGIKTDGNIHTVLKKNDGWENWNVKYHFDEDHLKAFTSNTDLIYLTSESDTVLETLDAKNIYCIGGLVDHNHHKNFCHERATKAGLRTARLPLGEYVDMKTRDVLTTYHVFEILLRVSEGKTWTDAILQTIPSRKGAKPKEVNLKENDKINDESESFEPVEAIENEKTQPESAEQTVLEPPIISEPTEQKILNDESNEITQEVVIEIEPLVSANENKKANDISQIEEVTNEAS